MKLDALKNRFSPVEKIKLTYDDLYYGEEDSGGSSLTTGILSAVTMLGQTAIQATQTPNVNYNYPYRPPTNLNINPVTGQPYGPSQTNSGGMLLFIIIIIGALFFLPKLVRGM